MKALWCVVLVFGYFYGAVEHAQPQPSDRVQDLPSSMASNHPISLKQRDKAEHLYLAGARAFMKADFALASFKFHEALVLDSTNRVYAAAAAMVDDRRQRGLAVVEDPVPESSLTFAQRADGPATLRPVQQRASVHMQAAAQEVIRQCFASFGIRVLFDDSVPNEIIRADFDDASFTELSRGLEMLTRTFFVPMAEDRAIVYKDTIENRQHFEPLGYETINASSLQPDQVVEIQNIARSLLGIKDVVVETGGRKITLRGPQDRLLLFNEAFGEIYRSRAEVVIDVQIYQLARSRTRNLGLQLPQQANVFNVNAEARKLISDNQSVVDQAISSGLVTSDDTLGIVALLIEGGYASSSPLGEGFAVFGGGISWSALSFGTTTLHLALNSSESHLSDKIQMRLKDGEKGTLRNGSRYPIATSQYSSITSSSNLSSSQLEALGLSSSSTSTSSTVPQVQYEDLGLTLAATPKVHANDDIELHLDLVLRNLSGSSLNDIPILTNRQFVGDIAVRSGETAVLSSSVTEQESKALSGVPGLSELPGFQTASTGGDRDKDTDEVLVIVTPHLIRPSRSESASEQMLLPFHREDDE